MKRLTSIVLLLLVGVAVTKAQTTESFLSIYGGLAQPTGNFGEDVGTLGDGIGYATTGFSLGADYVRAVDVPNVPPFGWVTSVFLTRNGRSSQDFDSLVREFERNMEKLERQLAEFDFENITLLYGAEASTGSWENAVLLTGLQYQTPVNATLEAYGTLQLGFALVRPPDYSLSLFAEVVNESRLDAQLEIDMKSALSQAFMVGGGVLIQKRFNIGLRILSTQPRLKYNVVVNEDINFEDAFDLLANGDVGSYEEGRGAFHQPISMIQLLVGLNF